MKSGDGVRVYFQFDYRDKNACRGRDVTTKSYDHIAIKRDGQPLLINDLARVESNDVAMRPYIEAETLTVLKYARRLGLNVRIPYTIRIAHEDMIFNFPVFVCCDAEVASTMLKGFSDLISAWAKDKHDRLVSFSLDVYGFDDKAEKSYLPIESPEAVVAHISFAGHVQDLLRLFDSVGTEFPDSAHIYDWIEKIYETNNEFKVADSKPSVSSLLRRSGELYFPRQFVPGRYISKFYMDNDALCAELISDQRMYNELTRRRITIAPNFLVRRSVCEKCGRSYIECEHVKFIDDVSEKIVDGSPTGVTWTNRHADPKAGIGKWRFVNQRKK